MSSENGRKLNDGGTCQWENSARPCERGDGSRAAYGDVSFAKDGGCSGDADPPDPLVSNPGHLPPFGVAPVDTDSGG